MTGQLLLFALVGVVFTAIIAAAVAIHMLEAIHVREEAHRLAVTPTATVAAPEPEPNRVWCVLCGDVIDTDNDQFETGHRSIACTLTEWGGCVCQDHYHEHCAPLAADYDQWETEMGDHYRRTRKDPTHD